MTKQRKLFEEKSSDMEKIEIDNKSREEARKLVMDLERNKEFLVETLTNGRRVYITTDGKKISREGDRKIKDKDIKIHYNGETKPVNYIDDVLVDLIKKEVIIGGQKLEILLNAIRDSIELKPIDAIMEKYPELKELNQMELPGHSIELLLAIVKLLGLQEDINYWGINPKSKKKEPYEGRYKPYNALFNLFIRNREKSLKRVMKKHQLG